MTVYTESKHAGEFIVSQANGALSREAATLTSGQKVVDGTVMAFATGKLVAMEGDDIDSEGASNLAGIVIGNWDASATGTNADILQVPYIARVAEVNDALLTYPAESSEGGEKVAVVAALLDAMIVVR